jgi:hypothetical protein
VPEWGIDGNWIDVCSLLIAVVFAVYKFRKARGAGGAQKLFSKKTGLDIANGTAFFPLFLLGLSIFSSRLTHELLGSNKLVLSIAGLFALFALLEDEI